MTYQQAAQSALAVQNGCNVSGIINSLNDIKSVLWTEANARGFGTRWVNRHPILAMFLFKLGELNTYGISSLQPGYEVAEKECQAIIAGLPERDYSEGCPF